ncbi:MAG: hypothetical protein ACLSCV_05400 [Acutalibacteraceae bacterium]
MPYLENFNTENHTNVVSVGAIHVEPMVFTEENKHLWMHCNNNLKIIM